MYIFLGASISSRSTAEAEKIADRIRRLCSVLDRLGHTYDASILTDPSVSRESKDVEFEIPDKYLSKISDALVRSIQGLRVTNPPYSLRDEIACYQWSLDLLDQAGAGIWDLTKSSSGSGFEIAMALQMKLPCLVLFDRPTVSTMINGCTNRLLMVRRWDDNLEQTIEQFIRKAEQAYDQVIKFNVTQDLDRRIKRRLKEAGFKTVSDYMRYLVEQDQQQNEG